MGKELTITQLVQKVQQQEDTVTQLVRIIASTNHRISELKIKQDAIEKLVLK